MSRPAGPDDNVGDDAEDKIDDKPGDEIDDKIKSLGERLTEATGGRRLELLIELGGTLTQRVLGHDLDGGDVAGPSVAGPSVAGPSVAERNAAEQAAAAIEVLRQALELVPADDPRRPDLNWRLGVVHAVRFVKLGGTDEDRDAAIAVLEGYLRAPGIPEKEQHRAEALLGFLLMTRVLPMPMTIGGGLPDAYDFLPLMAGFQLSEDGEKDLQQAIAILERSAGAGIEPQARRMATGLHAIAMCFRTLYHQPAEDGADVSHVLALLSKAGAELTEDDPGRAEIVGLHALLRADHARTSGAADPAVVDELHKAAEVVPYGHLLHFALRHELGLADTDHADRRPPAHGEPAHGEPAHGEPAQGEPARGEPDGRAAEPPPYEDGLRLLATSLVTSNAFRPTADGVEKVVSLAEEVLERRDPADTAGVAKDTYLLGMALTLRARLTGRQEDWISAAGRLRRSLMLIPNDDPLAATMLVTFGTVLNDRHLRLGGLDDAEAAQTYLARASAIQTARGLARPGPGGAGAGDYDLLLTTGLCGASRLPAATRGGDGAALDLAVTELQTALDGLPRDFTWRSRLLMNLGLARMARGGLRKDVTELHQGIKCLREADEVSAIDAGSMIALRAVGGIALVADGLVHSDGELVRRGIGKLTEAAGAPTVVHGERAHFLCCLGTAHLVSHQLDGAAEQLELGIARLEQACSLYAGEPGHPGTAHALWQLATAYRRRADRDMDDPSAAIESGLLALRARTNDVLLQTGAEHALVTARGAAAMALSVARWCLELDRHAAALEAIEVGRGLVLHAATSVTLVPELLRAARHDELADEWEAYAAAAPGSWGDAVAAAGAGAADEVERLGLFAVSTLAQQAPNELRQRVLAVLHETGHAATLLAPPSIQDVGAALRTVGADALVYLLPGGSAGAGAAGADVAGADVAGARNAGAEDAGEPGRLLVLTKDAQVTAVPVAGLRVDEDGPVRAFADCLTPSPERSPAPEEWRRRLEEVCDWAWPRGIQPLLDHGWGDDPGRPARLILVPIGELGVVPGMRRGRRPGRGTAPAGPATHRPPRRRTRANAWCFRTPRRRGNSSTWPAGNRSRRPPTPSSSRTRPGG